MPNDKELREGMKDNQQNLGTGSNAEYRGDTEKWDERHPETAVVVQSGAANFLVEAIRQKYDPELIREMMAIERENKADIARVAYFEAVAAFKAEAPQVKKDRHNKFFDSWYTSLGNLLSTYNPVLGRFGLSISFSPPEQTEKTMTVECRLSHRLGHTESVSMTGPIDVAATGKESGKRSRNPMQDMKSTFTYLRSVTCEAVLGVAGTEGTFDDDGNSAGGQGDEFITDEQRIELEKTIVEKGVDGEAFFKYMKVETTDTILAKDFGKAKNALKKAKGTKEAVEPK